MLTPTEKVRRFRARKRRGRAVFSAEVDVGPLADMLTGYGFLQEWDDTDRQQSRGGFPGVGDRGVPLRLAIGASPAFAPADSERLQFHLDRENLPDEAADVLEKSASDS